MKDKKLSWFLLPAVIAIWGMIGWKVYAAIAGEEEAAHVPVRPTERLADTSATPAQYTLLLNYRDPFFETKPKPKPAATNPVKPGQAPVKASVPAPAAAAWPVVSYGGLVRQTQSGKTVGFLVVNGTSYFVNAGDAVDELAVRSLWSDSIEVRFGKESRRFRK